VFALWACANLLKLYSEKCVFAYLFSKKCVFVYLFVFPTHLSELLNGKSSLYQACGDYRRKVINYDYDYLAFCDYDYDYDYGDL